VGGTFTVSATASSVGGTTGGTIGSTIDGICGSGCEVDTNYVHCEKPLITLVCPKALSAQRTILVANGCTDIPTGMVRYCCPAVIQTQCQ
jgi:hypothetical protein